MICEIRGCGLPATVAASWLSEGDGTRLDWFRLCDSHSVVLREAHKLDGWYSMAASWMDEEEQ